LSNIPKKERKKKQQQKKTKKPQPKRVAKRRPIIYVYEKSKHPKSAAGETHVVTKTVS
jgi:hypothetical protein